MKLQLPRFCGYGSYSFQSRANSRIPPTQCSTPISLTPNIRLILIALPFATLQSRILSRQALSPARRPSANIRGHANLLDRWPPHRRSAPSPLESGFSSTITLPLLRSSIRIDAALDLRDPLLVLQDHRHDGNHAAYDDGHNRHQQSTQTN